MGDLLQLINEKFSTKTEEDIEELGFLPKNKDYSEVMICSQEEVESNPKKFIIEECLPACKELWSKNIYTYMVSDYLNKGECWIEIQYDLLSDENKEIYDNLDCYKFSYHHGNVNFGVKCVGREGQQKLLELAKLFKMQDVPEKEGYIYKDEFLLYYCDCYDEVPNPDYKKMKSPAELETDDFDYLLKYSDWLDSIESKEYIKKYNPNKIDKPLEQLVLEHNMIYENGRIYLSSFHYNKHKNYVKYLENKNIID